MIERLVFRARSFGHRLANVVLRIANSTFLILAYNILSRLDILYFHYQKTQSIQKAPVTHETHSYLLQLTSERAS